jgi:hypothetical protein
MWPFNRKAIEQKSTAGNGFSSAFFPLGGGRFMARTSEPYAKEGYDEKVIALPAFS